MNLVFNWNEIQHRPGDGKTFLLYRHERIFEEKLVKPGDLVLDVGGWGMLANRLLEEECMPIILDNFSEDQYYPDRVKELPHINADIETILWQSKFYKMFDVITCFEMLEHTINPENALCNMGRMLNAEGIIVGTVPLPGHCHAADEEGIHFLDIPTLTKYLTAAGFIDINIEPTPSLYKEDKPVSLYFKAIKS